MDESSEEPRVLARVAGKTFLAASVKRPDDFTPPFPGAVFPCLIWDHDSGWTDDDRLRLAAALLASGCRYAVCAGDACGAWHDAVDLAFVQAHPETSGEAWETDFVMTSWHEGESPADVAFFFVLNTNFDAHDFHEYLVLHVGTGPQREALNAAVRAQALGRR